MITQNTIIEYNSQWRNTVLQELYLEVDTTFQPITITLPEISSMGGFYNVKFYISDKTGNSSNNPISIVTQGVDLINSGTTVSITTNFGSIVVACVQSSWIGLLSTIVIPTPTPPAIILLADGKINMGANEPQELNAYCKKSIVTDVVIRNQTAPIALTQQGSLRDDFLANYNLIAAFNFNIGIESALKFDGNYIDKDVTFTGGATAVRIEGVVQQTVRDSPFYFQSLGLDTGVAADIYVYGYSLD